MYLYDSVELEINLIQNDSLINILIVYDCAAVVHCATCNNTCINGPFKIICSYFLLLIKTQDWILRLMVQGSIFL